MAPHLHRVDRYESDRSTARVDHIAQLHKLLVREEAIGHALLLERQRASISSCATPEQAVEGSIGDPNAALVKQILELVLPKPVNTIAIEFKSTRVWHVDDVHLPILHFNLSDRKEH